MIEKDIAEYVEKMKDKPRKQIHCSGGYKPKWYWYPEPEDLPWLAGGITIILIYVLALLGVI